MKFNSLGHTLLHNDLKENTTLLICKIFCDILRRKQAATSASGRRNHNRAKNLIENCGLNA